MNTHHQFTIKKGTTSDCDGACLSPRLGNRFVGGHALGEDSLVEIGVGFTCEPGQFGHCYSLPLVDDKARVRFYFGRPALQAFVVAIDAAKLVTVSIPLSAKRSLALAANKVTSDARARLDWSTGGLPFLPALAIAKMILSSVLADALSATSFATKRALVVAMMFRKMLSVACAKDEVFNPIIHRIFILVVDAFARDQRPANVLFHDDAVAVFIPPSNPKQRSAIESDLMVSSKPFARSRWFAATAFAEMNHAQILV